ncbi:hypothetical protein [Streptomyces macrosporus]|uniref:Uncharacterized protein n=1 Tax=Streptomyces macrosporus TaxID=44032 RepID=A0ABP5XKB8_9ACTN
MTDKDNQERPEEPFVAGQLFVTDLKRTGVLAPFDPLTALSMRRSVMGSTNFENKDLEEMFSLVDNANPEDIEDAADTLWKAGGDIRTIGEDLKKHIDKVDWEGEFGDSFREWGRKLSKNTLILADFTEKASTQLKAAGVGLATVKGSMPERDPAVMAAPRLESIPPEERDESNEKYKLAKKKEDNRQEAINQMNRLASYYKVSHENMQGLEEPDFGPMPNIGMPPAPTDGGEGVGKGGGATSSAVTERGGTPQSVRSADVQGPSQPVSDKPGFVEGTPAPQEPVRTELNTVAPPAPAPTDTGQRAPVTSNGGGPVSPSTGLPTPLPGISHNRPVDSGKRVGTAKLPPVSNPGQPGAGRAGGPSTVPPANNATPRSVTGSGGTPVGKAPTATAPPVGRGGNGIYGGTPQQGGTAGNSPRIPRGTVVGAEHGMTGRPPAGSVGTGAIGAGTGSGSTGRRPVVGTGGGVVGAPRNTPGQGAAARPFTPGGTGLARGGATGGNQPPVGAAPRTGTGSPREENRNDSRRPDYLTEDEETWRTGRNGIAPPVVE